MEILATIILLLALIVQFSGRWMFKSNEKKYLVVMALLYLFIIIKSAMDVYG